MKRNKGEETKSDKTVEQKQHATPNYRRPYGLLQKAGVSTAGMTPRDAWSAWNELRKEERAAKEKKPKAAKIPMDNSQGNRQKKEKIVDKKFK